MKNKDLALEMSKAIAAAYQANNIPLNEIIKDFKEIYNQII